MMGFNFVNIEQRTPEWHEFRKGKVGASMAPTIMDENPYQTRLDLWEEIVFGKEREVTPFMKRGIELEPEALEWVNSHFNFHLKPVVIQSSENPQFIASLDGYCEMHGQIHLVEIKCPGAETHLQATKGEIPKRYFAQLQHQMMVANVPVMNYVSYDGNRGVLLEIERDQAYCNGLFIAETAFLSCVEEFRPPESTNRDWIKMSDPEDVRLGNELLGFKTALKAMKKKEEALEAEILKRATHSRCEFGDLKVQKIVKKGNIDYKSIEALKEMDLEPYRKAPSEYWRFG